MIVLFTDFGLHGPYTGQMKAVLHQAYLLAAYATWFPTGTIFLCVVDPGVGGTRPAIILEADGRWYVGPACRPDASLSTDSAARSRRNYWFIAQFLINLAALKQADCIRSSTPSIGVLREHQSSGSP